MTLSESIPTLKTGHTHSHPAPLSGASYSAVELMPGNRAVLMLDQRILPKEERHDLLLSVDEVCEGIRSMRVRGAPAIGIAAAYGMVLAAAAQLGDAASFEQAMATTHAQLVATRPTAVNLKWAADRMLAFALSKKDLPSPQRLDALGEAARTIHQEDVAACKRIGELGQINIPDGATILTVCNAGALATGGYGTALGVIRAAHAQKKKIRVIACETRPLLQGARLTAWELQKDGIDVTLIADGAAAQLFARKAIQLVIVGADRIARNGDTANKVGTYSLACLAKMHGVPFEVAAPWSTVDLACESGAVIPIEQRSAREVLTVLAPSGEVAIAPVGVKVENPAFDVTPAELIRAIHTERGTIQPVNAGVLTKLGEI